LNQTWNPISQEILDEELSFVFTKLEKATASKQVSVEFSKNGLDPFTAAISAGASGGWDNWQEAETIRQIQKALENEIGAFHQRLLGRLPGWQSLPRADGQPDLICPDRKIFVELKNKHNTVSGKDLSSHYDNLLRNAIYFPREKLAVTTLRSALEHVPPSDGASYPAEKARVMKMIPPGGNWRDLPTAEQKRYMKGSFALGGGKTGLARRLSFDEPSLTLTTAPAQNQTERCHPVETRPLTVREYARIQTFPDDWIFAGSTASQYRQIGNAVPVNLGYHIGIAIRNSLGEQPARATVETPLEVVIGE